MGKALGECLHLKKLTVNLFNNKIEEEGAGNLCKPLTNLKHLRDLSLNLSGNKLFTYGITNVAQNLQTL